MPRNLRATRVAESCTGRFQFSSSTDKTKFCCRSGASLNHSGQRSGQTVAVAIHAGEKATCRLRNDGCKKSSLFNVFRNFFIGFDIRRITRILEQSMSSVRFMLLGGMARSR